MALANDYTFRLFFLLSKILQMNAIKPITQLVDDFNRIFRATDVMAEICAEADAFVYCLYDAVVTGDVSTPLAVAVSTLAWPNNPPRRV